MINLSDHHSSHCKCNPTTWPGQESQYDSFPTRQWTGYALTNGTPVLLTMTMIKHLLSSRGSSLSLLTSAVPSFCVQRNSSSFRWINRKIDYRSHIM